MAARDDDGSTSELCGLGCFDFAPIVRARGKSLPATIFLTNAGQKAGTIQVELAFVPVTELRIKLLRAELKEDLDMFNKMDPFAVVAVGEATRRTSIKEEAGKNPVWNEEFVFPLPE